MNGRSSDYQAVDEEEDDAELNDLLDNLITSAQGSVDVTQVDATTSIHDQTFTPDTIPEAIESCNILLHSNNLPRLPRFDQQDERKTLALSLSLLVRVLRANSANVQLRQEAEKALEHTENLLQTSRQTAQGLKQKLETSKDNNASMKKRHEAAKRELEAKMKKQVMEVSQLRSKLQSSISNEKSAVQDVQQKKKELALLRQRTHSLIAKSGTPITPRITPTSISVTNSRTANLKSSSSSVIAKERSEALINDCNSIDRTENEQFRELLRAVQEELDDLIVSCDQTEVPYLEQAPVKLKENEDGAMNILSNAETTVDKNDTYKEQSSILQEIVVDGEDDDENDEDEELPEGTSWDKVLSSKDIAPAPSEDQMRLPFEVIREEFEESLERKLQWIRAALPQANM